jgi:xylulokinase
MQATSDISGLDQEVCARTTGAAYGDAFLARVALGDATVEEIADWNPVERKVVAEARREYAKAYPLFRRLYEQTKDIARELSE